MKKKIRILFFITLFFFFSSYVAKPSSCNTDNDNNKSTIKSSDLNYLLFFKAVWENNIDEVKKYIAKGYDVNRIIASFDIGTRENLVKTYDNLFPLQTDELKTIFRTGEMQISRNVTNSEGLITCQYQSKIKAIQGIMVRIQSIRKLINIDKKEWSTLEMGSISKNNFSFIFCRRKGNYFKVDNSDPYLTLGSKLIYKEIDHIQLNNLGDIDGNYFVVINPYNALMIAIKMGYQNMFEILLDASTRIDEENRYGENALVLASDSGHVSFARSLIEQNIDINKIDKNGNTPLIRSLLNKKKGIVNLLLTSGANVNIKTKTGENALFIASQKGYSEIVKSLCLNNSNINDSDNNGITPLMIASKNGHESVVRILLDSQADVNIKSNSGKTALFFGAQGGDLEVVNLLILNNSDIQEFDTNGVSPLMIASRNRHLSIVKILLNSGVDVNIKSKTGKTALFFGAQGGNPELVKLLISNGSNISDSDTNGVTPLMIASKNGNESVVELLIESGSEIDKKDKMGNTAIIHASYSGSTDCLRKLYDSGGNLIAKNNENKTAKIIAKERFHSQTSSYIGWEKPNHFGFRISMALSFPNNNEDSKFYTSVEFDMGPYWSKRLGPGMRLQNEILFSMRELEIKDYPNEQVFSYDNNPEFFKLYYLNYKPSMTYNFFDISYMDGYLYLIGGPEFHILSSAKMGNYSYTSNKPKEVKQSVDKFSFGYNAGIGLKRQTNNGLFASIELRYSYNFRRKIDVFRNSFNVFYLTFGVGF